MAAITATVDGRTETWKDKKRWIWPVALLVPMLPFGAYREATRWGLDVFWFLGPLWILVFVPILDTIIGTDKGNPARNAACRPMFPPVVPCCKALPITRSSTSAGSMAARATAARMAWLANS